MIDEVAYLRRKLKESKNRKEDLEDQVGDITYANEKLQAEMDKAVQEITSVKKLLPEKQSITNKNIKATDLSDNFIDELKRQNDNVSKCGVINTIRIGLSVQYNSRKSIKINNVIQFRQTLRNVLK